MPFHSWGSESTQGHDLIRFAVITAQFWVENRWKPVTGRRLWAAGKVTGLGRVMGIRGGCEYGFWRECDIPELEVDEQAREKDTMGDLQDPGFTPRAVWHVY